MVVVAHADDAEFGCAGTAARWAKEGWDVYYVICTDGGSGGPDDATDVSEEARQKTVETRMQEQRKACSILGVKDVFFLGQRDGVLQPTIELRKKLVRLYRTYKPSRLICQSPVRSWEPALSIGAFHPDHLAAGEAALACAYPASQNPWDFPELFEQEGLKPHKIKEIFVMSAPNNNYISDISTTIELKSEALRAHVSQLSDHFDEVRTWLTSYNADAGKKIGAAYAEEFHRTENW
ncbi:PIG-L family deacetylase [Ktedonosporobacter rubrisoli]|uniref:PIG-L family deacetylase n=2 Tax=Ktedonosporobacter rubrisoli TaxID=2509675 RepID=A0A4P6K5Z8_KTERU|nr:PIG-L family deacetylase [Ktedonosporobacter rubrisoli]